MKVRNGFVSNSSSSSFIVFIPENNSTVNGYNNIKNFFDHNFCIDIESDDIIEDLNLEKIKKHIKDGFGVTEIDVDYGCVDGIEDIINKLCDNYYLYYSD